jgi:hypothetical protein
MQNSYRWVFGSAKMRAQYIIPALLTFLFAIFLWQIEKERRKLEYDVVQSAAFPREGGTGKYFIINLNNGGNTTLGQIQLEIAFDSNVIDSFRFADPTLITNLSHNMSMISGVIPLLNPDESASVTITTFSQTEARAPTVIARAPGATAIRRTTGGISEELSWVLIGVVGAALAVTGFSFVTSSRTARVSDSISKIENLGEVSKRIERTEEDLKSKVDQQLKELEEASKRREQGEPQQQQIIFALMNRAGLGHRFMELASDDLSYWRTGLFLLQQFVIDETNRNQYISAMQELVDVPEMAPSSKGFNLYLLAKMEQLRSNSEAAIKWLELCRKHTPLMYDYLMAQDPAYDLEALRRHLISIRPQNVTESARGTA